MGGAGHARQRRGEFGRRPPAQHALRRAVSSRHARLAATILPNIEIQILDIATEAEIRQIAEHGGVPVPHVHGVCLDPDYVGGPFFVSDCVDGETIPRRVLRLVAQSGTGPRLAAQIGSAIGRLHAIDAASAPVSLPRPEGGRPVAHALDLVRPPWKACCNPNPRSPTGCAGSSATFPTSRPGT